MIKVRRIGHAVFETGDIERLTDHYTDVVGLVVAARERDTVYLATRVGQLAVELRRGSNIGCHKLSFEIHGDAELADVTRHLATLGIKSERNNDRVPGIANTLTFKDPKGTEIELFTSWDAIANGETPKGVPVVKLGHVAFFVTDLNKTIEFYKDVLGFRISDWIGDFFVFMRCNPDHHTVNFVSDPRERIHHIAFEVEDWGQIKTACDILARQKIDLAWGPLRHGAGHNISIYYPETDGQIVELFTELDQMFDEELGYFEPRPWHRDRPQRPKVWEPGPTANIWGPLPTERYLHKR